MPRVRARVQVVALALGMIGGAGTLGLVACTVFNGVVLPDDGVDGSMSVDGGLEAGNVGDATVIGDAAEASVTLPPIMADGAPYPSFFTNIDQAVQLCNDVATCTQLAPSLQFVMGLPVQQGNFSACVDLFAGPRPPANEPTASQLAMLQQVLAATTCAAQLDVLPYEVLADNSSLCADAGAYCVPSPTKTGTTDTVSCDEGILYHCASSGFVAGSNCDTVALDCVTPNPCGAGAACDGVFQRSCDPTEARDGGQPSEDCSLFGATCDDVLGCALDGRPATCNTAAPFACSGASITACIATNAETVDCPGLGATCDDSHSYAFCALPGGCTPFSDGVNQCASDGTTISLCVGGVNGSYNCANVGLVCKADSNFLSSCVAQ